MSAFTNPLLLGGDQETWHALNETRTGRPVASVADLVLDQVRAGPGRPAVMSARRTLSYAELAAAAARVAVQLDRSDGAVLICVEPGWEQAVAVLAAILTGVPFHAVHPESSRPARWVTAGGLGARTVLTQSWLAERMAWPSGTHLIHIDETPTTDAGSSVLDASRVPASAEDVACLLAANERGGPARPLIQGAIADTISDLAGRFDLGPDDRCLSVTSAGDEVSLTALLLMLGIGGAVVMPDDIDLWTPATWMTLMARDQVSVWHSTPSLAAVLAEHLAGRHDGLPSSLRVVLLGGEPVAASLVNRLRGSSPAGIRVGHLGVPGSPGLWASCYEVPDPAQGGYLPVGVPLGDRELHVLGQGGAPCPVWVSGKVFVGGRFPAIDPAGAGGQTDPGALWPTDLIGRLLPEGVVEVVGEDSTRITVQGHPLQLREVESALLEHGSVLAVAVVPSGPGSSAYVRISQGADITAEVLLGHLRRKMSPYLLPAAIEPVGRFALSPDGRIDRKVLADNASRGEAPAASRPELGAVPAELLLRACALASRILDISDVEPTMNLMDIGASSIQLVRIAVAAEDELGLQVDIDELMRFPSIEVMVSAATPVAPAASSPPELHPEPDDEAGETLGTPASWDRAVGVPGTEDLRDPLARLAFKDSRPGTRRDLPVDGHALAVPGQQLQFLGRGRTVRRFAGDAVPAHQLQALLAVLCELPSDNADVHHGYPSAGSLYPIQAYLAVRRDRVDGLGAGTYYLHPALRRLLPVERRWEAPQSAHGWINREAASTSAFSIHLVARQTAILPMYGERARDYCIFEAGSMCQLLMTTAAELMLGLCPVGEMDAVILREPLGLAEGDELVHTLLGGLPVQPGDDVDPADQAADMLRRIGDAALGSLERPER